MAARRKTKRAVTANPNIFPQGRDLGSPTRESKAGRVAGLSRNPVIPCWWPALPLRPLGLEEHELVSDKRIAFIDKGTCTIGRELPELLHHHIDNVLVLERFYIDLLTIVYFSNGDDQRPHHPEFFQDAQRVPEPQERDPDVPVNESDCNTPLLCFLDRSFHLGTGRNSHVEANLALEVRKQPLDEQGIEILDLEDILDGRVSGLPFQSLEPRGVQFDRHNLRGKFLNGCADFIHAFL
jgi:hypothetical protein